MFTYGDGVADIDLHAVLQFHKAHGKLATVTAVRPPARFGRMAIENDLVTEFYEKPEEGEGWISGGFFVLNAKVLNYIDGDQTVWEREPDRALGPRGPNGRLSASRILVLHGYAERKKYARGSLGIQQGTLEKYGIRMRARISSLRVSGAR